MYVLDKNKNMATVPSLLDIASSDEFYARLNNYEENQSYFNSNLKKEDYIKQLENYLHLQLRQFAPDKKMLIVIESIDKYIKNIVLPNYLKDITSIYSSKVAVEIKAAKNHASDIVNTSFAQLIINKNLFADLDNVFNNDDESMKKAIYNSVMSNDIHQETYKLRNYFYLSKDKETILNIFFSSSDKMKKNLMTIPAFAECFDITNFSVQMIGKDPELLSMVLKSNISKINKKNIKDPNFKHISDKLLLLDDKNKFNILMNPKLEKMDAWYEMKIINSINDSNLKLKLIGNKPELFDNLNEKDLANILNSVNPNDLIEFLQGKINGQLLVDEHLKKIVLASFIGIDSDYFKQYIFEEIQKIDPNLVSKFILTMAMINIKEAQVVKNIFLNQRLLEQINIFDYSFILQYSNLPDDEKRKILFDPLLQSKFQKYNISNINKQQPMEEIFVQLNKIYVDKFKTSIEDKHVDVQLLNNISISQPIISDILFIDDNIETIMESLFSKENRNYQFEMYTMEYILERFTETINAKQGTPSQCYCCESKIFKSSETNGDYRHDSHMIRLNKSKISPFLINNIKVLNTIFHETRHAKQFTDMENEDNYFDLLKMVKDEVLAIRLFYGVDGYEPKKTKNFRNYKYCSYESDARCTAIVDTINYLKITAKDLADKTSKEYIDVLVQDLKIRDNLTRELDVENNLYDLDTIFDLECDKDKIAQYIKKYPVLLKEYHEDGTKREIVELLEQRQFHYHELNNLNIDKEQIRNNSNLLNTYSSVKKNISFYNKLINHKKTLSISSDSFAMPVFNLDSKFSEWELLSNYIPNDFELEKERVSYMIESISDYLKFQTSIKPIKINGRKPITERFNDIYINTLNTIQLRNGAFVDEDNLNVPKDMFDLYDTINLLQKYKSEIENINQRPLNETSNISLH